MDDKKNMGFYEIGIHLNLEFQELEDIINETFFNPCIYKDKTKAFQDKYLSRKTFEIGQKVLLYDSRLKWFSRKLRSQCIGPFIVTNVYDHGAIEIKKYKNRKSVKS